LEREAYERAFNLQKLVQAMHLFDQLLGREWIWKKIEERDKRHKGDKHSFLCEEDEHPVIRNWPLHVVKDEGFEKDRKIYPAQQLALIVPALCIGSAMRIKRFDEAVSKINLRDPIRFESFVFECKIGSVYARSGYDVEFFPEQRASKTPDFIVKYGDENVFIECKKKMFTRQEKMFRDRVCEVSREMLGMLDDCKQNAYVIVESRNIMEDVQAEDLADELKRQIADGVESGCFSMMQTSVKWRRSLPFNFEKAGGLVYHLPHEPNYLINTTELFVDSSGNVKHRNPRVIAFYTEVVFDRTGPLVDRFKDALLQLEQYTPSVVYLEIERGTRIKSLVDAENCIKRLCNPSSADYDKKSNKANWIVFTDIQITEESGMIGARTVSRAAINEHACSMLPPSFLRFGRWFPGNVEPTAIVNEGVEFAKVGRFQEALQYYDFALALSPHVHEAWNNKGNALNMIGNFQEALKCLNTALSLNPNYASAWINKGISSASIGNMEEAIKCFDNAISLDPKVAEAWYNKGLLLFKLGRFKEATLCANESIKIDPHYDEAKKLKEKCDSRAAPG